MIFFQLTGVLALKAPTYKVIEENSKRQDSYFYSLEKRGRKTFHRIFSETPELPKPTWGNGNIKISGAFCLFVCSPECTYN